MLLVNLLVGLAIIVVFLWVINSVIQMDAKIKTIFNVIVAVIVLLWLMQVFGIFTTLTVPRLR